MRPPAPQSIRLASSDLARIGPASRAPPGELVRAPNPEFDESVGPGVRGKTSDDVRRAPMSAQEARAPARRIEIRSGMNISGMGIVMACCQAELFCMLPATF